MTLLVGYTPDGRGAALLHLAAMLARSAQENLVVCAVVPSPWPPGPAQIEGEYGRVLDGMARAALERARERLPSDVAAASLVDHARSAPAGLLEVAERYPTTMVVVGTSGQPAIDSVTVSRAAAIAWRTPSSVSKVSTSMTAFSGASCMNAENASRSSSKDST
jgi:nucleotide-binding universal stress UspA family protein